jgi:hypothetical protein
VAYGGAISAVSNFQLQFSQGPTVLGTLPGGALTAGAAWKWSVELDAFATSLAYGAELWTGTSMAYLGQGAMASFDPAQDLEISLVESAAAGNATSLRLGLIELG